MVATRLLCACRTYYRVIYTRVPSQRDFIDLALACNDIRCVYYLFKASQPPSVHYMLSHLLDMGMCDGTFHDSLQEGVEHHHQNDREYARNVYRHSDGKYSRLEIQQQLLKQQQLRRILIARGHRSPKHQAV